MIWREKRILLIILGVLLAANTIFFFTYRVQYQSRLDALDERLAERGRAAARAGAHRAAARRAAGRRATARIEQRRAATSSTSTGRRRPQRLTLLIGEVKRLAVASNLDAEDATRSTQTEAVDSVAARAAGRGAQSLGATEVGIVVRRRGHVRTGPPPDQPARALASSS